MDNQNNIYRNQTALPDSSSTHESNNSSTWGNFLRCTSLEIVHWILQFMYVNILVNRSRGCLFSICPIQINVLFRYSSATLLNLGPVNAIPPFISAQWLHSPILCLACTSFSTIVSISALSNCRTWLELRIWTAWQLLTYWTNYLSVPTWPFMSIAFLPGIVLDSSVKSVNYMHLWYFYYARIQQWLLLF